MIYRKEKNNISLREINKKNILKIVIDIGPISRINISRRLKISRPTTSAYISELIDDGLIEEIGKSDSTSLGGKKAVLLQFNARVSHILGVMIGVKTIRIASSTSFARSTTGNLPIGLRSPRQSTAARRSSR